MPEDIESQEQRDRVLGFSIAAADLLLELDRSHRITFASGAARYVSGDEVETLVGRPFPSLVSSEDRERLEALFAASGETVRPQPAAIRMAETGSIVVCGICRLRSADDRVYVTLSHTKLPGQNPMAVAGRDPQTGVLSAEKFIGAARDLVFGARELGVDATLTLLQLPEDSEPEPDEGEGEDPWADAVARLRDLSLGDAVGRVSDSVYAMIHDGTVAIEHVKRAFAVDQDSPDHTVEACQFRLSPDGLSPQDVANVISYAMAKFSENGPQEFSIESLSGGMKMLVRETVNRLAVLRQSVINQAFRIVFQPIVSLADDGVHHYEVLSRFPGGDAPHRTVAFAESIGLIEDLDLAVCRKAIDVVRETADAGEAVSLAVNISARSLRSSILVGTVDQLLSTLGGLRSKIMLEITETDHIEDLHLAENVIQQFRTAGNPVCLDDFGAGASSFQYFQALTVDYAKIDGAYVRQVQTNDRDAAILKAMVSLCRDLNVRTVAEMVETREQAEALRLIGVDYGQGWLFGKPFFNILTPPDPEAVGQTALGSGRRIRHSSRQGIGFGGAVRRLPFPDVTGARKRKSVRARPFRQG